MSGAILQIDAFCKDLDASKWHTLDAYYLRLLQLQTPVDLERHVRLESGPDWGDSVVLGEVPKSKRGLFPERMLRGDTLVFPIERRTEFDTGYLQRVEFQDLKDFCDAIVFLLTHLDFEMGALPP